MWVFPTLNPLSEDHMEDSPLGLKDSSRNLCVDTGVQELRLRPLSLLPAGCGLLQCGFMPLSSNFINSDVPYSLLSL